MSTNASIMSNPAASAVCHVDMDKEMREKVAARLGLKPVTVYQYLRNRYAVTQERRQAILDTAEQIRAEESNVCSDRPVMLKDIAEKLGMPLVCVKSCMSKKTTMSQAKVDLVRNTAHEMGYDAALSKSWSGKQTLPFLKPVSQKQCAKCGVLYVPNRVNQLYCSECRVIVNREHVMKTYRKHHPNWHGGNFHTREEEIARMQELRAQGYSNYEIDEAIGRSKGTTLRNIGKQDRELWLQNNAMAAHIRAQKNAARKQYLVNKPIREYNKRVEEHNKMKAEIARMEAELKPQTPVIEKAAQVQIFFPLVNLHTVQPTALQ